VNDEWKDIDIKQSKVSLPESSHVSTLVTHLAEKWNLNPNELIVRCLDKDFGEFIDIEEDFENVELQNLTKYEVVHRVGKWARNSREPSERLQKPPSVSTTVSENDEACTSDAPPSVKNEVIEIDDDELNQNAATPSTIDDISTKALSMFASTSPSARTNNKESNVNNVSTAYKLNVLDQLERSEYGRQCLDHFDELASGANAFLSNPIKVKFVNIIGQWLMMNCRTPGQPSAEERRNFVSHCLSQLPCELNPDVFTNKDGTGTLDNYVKNKRQASKRRDGYLLMAKRPRLDSSAGSSSSTSENNEIDIAEVAVEQIVYDMANMDSSLFKKQIIEKHKETLRYRRRWIEETLKKDLTTRDKMPHMILTRYPQMTRINELITIDFEYVAKKKFPNWTSKSLATDWEQIWSKKILHYAINNGNPFAVNALRDYGLEKIPSISDEDRCIFSLRLLPSLLQGKGTKVTGSDADSLIVEIKQDNRSIVSAIDSVRKVMDISVPLILQLTSYEPEFQSSYFVLIEETAIPVEGNFSRALELLVQCYNALELPYPPRLHGVYRILEYFYGFQSMRRTSCFIQFIDILEKCPI